MISHLSGPLLSKTTQSVIIDACGVGYEVLVPLSTFYAIPEVGERVSLHIYTHVREDALLLFGFHTRLEKDIFLMLISVAGIGPKLAVNVLSGIGPEELLKAIAQGDAVRLRSIPGVGKKIAERIALELRDRAQKAVGEEPALGPAPPVADNARVLEDALSALINLGYAARPAKEAVERARSTLNEVTLEALIREALRVLA